MNILTLRSAVHASQILVLSLLGFCIQQPNLEPATPGEKPIPVVSFEVAFPGAIPAHYFVGVESTGNAAYQSDDMSSTQNEAASGVPYMEKFTVSSAAATRIFQLAQQAGHFKMDCNYKGNVAATGTKTLSYSEGPADSFGRSTAGVRTRCAFNYSENPAIQQLTSLFENISNTLELGREIRRLHRFDKLGLDAEFKNAEDLAANHKLAELQLIAPTLREIADDSSVLNIVRQKAKHLLDLARKQ